MAVFSDDGAPQAKFGGAIERYVRLREVGGKDSVVAPRLTYLYLGRGELDLAEQECARWAKASPSVTATEMARKLHELQIERAYFQRILPSKFKVIHVGKVEGVPVALTAVQEEGGYGYKATRLHTVGPDGLKEFKLGNPWLEGDTGANELTMLARDMDGDGRAELLVENVFYGASWTPSVMYVFRVGKDERISQVGAQAGHDPLGVHKDNRGRWCIRSVDAIGSDLSHAEQPRWPTYTRVSGNKLVESGPGFPADYRESLNEINDCLTRHPKDYDLLQHKAETLAFIGETEKSRKTYADAAKSLEIYINSPDNKAWFKEPEGKKTRESLVRALKLLRAKAVGKGVSTPLPNPRG